MALLLEELVDELDKEPTDPLPFDVAAAPELFALVGPFAVAAVALPKEILVVAQYRLRTFRLPVIAPGPCDPEAV
jgi:hypothetical protein